MLYVGRENAADGRGMEDYDPALGTQPPDDAADYPRPGGGDGWTKHTVITLLKRMMQKGTVRMEEAEPARRYYPCVEKDKVAREQTQTLLSRLFEGRASLLVSNMVEQGELTDDEVDELMDILKRAKDQL